MNESNPKDFDRIKYTREEFEWAFSVVGSLASTKSSTSEEWTKNAEKLLADRFINIKMFSLYQELAAVDVIYAEMLRKMGELAPGKKFKNVTSLFIKVKAMLAVIPKKVDWILENIGTDEDLKEYMSDPALKESFEKNSPELVGMSVKQMADLKEFMGNVVLDENWGKFESAVKDKFGKMGIKFKGNNAVDISFTEEYFKFLMQNTEDEYSEEDSEIYEGFEDGHTFTVNPRHTQGVEVKMFLSDIINPGTKASGLPEYMDYDTVFEDLLRVCADLEKVTLPAIIKRLTELAPSRPYFRSLIVKLNKLETDHKGGFINELITVFNKAFTEQVMVTWDKKEGRIVTKVFYSNQQSVRHQVINDWLEMQKDSSIVSKNVKGDMEINQLKVTELRNLLQEEQKKKTKKINDLKELALTIFGALNIPFDEGNVEHLFEKANKGFFKYQGDSSAVALFGQNGLFERILKSFQNGVETTEETSIFEDSSNPMNREQGYFNKLVTVYLESSPAKYQTTGYQNAEGKTIYSYINRSYLENIKRKLKHSPDYLKEFIRNNPFSMESEYLQDVADGKRTLDFSYADGMKKENTDDGLIRRKMGEDEQLMESYLKFQNNGKKKGFFNLFTLSDKVTTVVSELDKYVLSGLDISFMPGEKTIAGQLVIENRLKQQLWSLAKGEINRIKEYSRSTAAGLTLNDAQFGQGWRFIYNFPVLNDTEQYPHVAELHARMTDDVPFSEADEPLFEALQDLLADTFKENVSDAYDKLVDKGLITIENIVDAEGTVTGTKVKSHMFDNAYLRKEKIDGIETGRTGLNTEQLMIYAVTDMQINYLRAQITAQQVLGMDPAQFYKHVDSVNKVDANKVQRKYDDFTTAEKYDLIAATIVEFSKRSALLIAPGSEGAWTWTNSRGEKIEREFYKIITLDDVVLDARDNFPKSNITDAQEFLTLQEHIDRMKSEGKVSTEFWEAATAVIEKHNGTDYNFFEEFFKTPGLFDTDEQRENFKEVLMEPTKPVYAGINQSNGFTKIDYIKSSTFVMIPGMIHGSQLDQLRKFMEKNKIQAAPFKSAKKTGQPQKLLKLFTDDSQWIEPSAEDLILNTQTLSREGLRTQQEIPHQKSEITNISQMNKMLFQGLLDVKGFNLTLPDGSIKEYTGKELKSLKEHVRKMLIEHSKEDVFSKLGISEIGGSLVFKDKRILVDLLKEEATTRGGYSENDLKSLLLMEDGEFAIPLYMLARGEKYEGLLNSIINRIILLKNPGTSLVQVSGVGHKYTFNQITDAAKSKIIWIDTKNYNAAEGLQYIRKDKTGEVLGAQVLVSQYITTENGSILDLEKFTKRVDGRMILDTSRIDPKILRMVGARIPNQGHSSMIPLEVVGFLPKEMKNTVIVPDGITGQMGSNFEIDRLFLYQSGIKTVYKLSALSETKKVETLIEKKFEKKYLDKGVFNELSIPSDKFFKVQELIKQIEKEKLKASDEDSDYENAKTNSQINIFKNRIAFILNPYIPKGIDDFTIETVQLKKYLKRVQLDCQNIERMTVTSYDLNDFKTGKKFSKSQLNELYKDIHWSVLTHPVTFEKITTSIDYPDLREEADILSFLTVHPEHWIPFSLTSQMEIYNDNRSGKKGISVFALLMTFAANHEDKDLYLHKKTIDRNTGKMIIEHDPVYVMGADENGEPVEIALSVISSTGNSTFNYKKGVKHKRCKNDNLQMVMNEALDNAKNKLMGLFNWYPQILGALGGLLTLSSQDKDQIVRISFATRFFPQQAVKQFIAEFEKLTSSLNENKISRTKEIALGNVQSYYEALLATVETKEELDSKNARKEVLRANGRPTYEVFSPDRLLDLLKMSDLQIHEMTDAKNDKSVDAETKDVIRRQLKDFFQAQLDVLTVFGKLIKYGDELSRITEAISIDSKGLGKDILTVYSKISKMAVIADHKESVISGLSNIAGEVEVDKYIGKVTFYPNDTETGHVLENSLFLAKKLYEHIYPIYSSPAFTGIVNHIFKNAGLNKSRIGSEKFISLQTKISNALKSYLFTMPDFEIFDDITKERERLLLDNDGNKSLGMRLKEMVKANPELEKNYFVNRIKVIISPRVELPSQVNYFAPYSTDLDESLNLQGFLALMSSKNTEEIMLAKDLIKYAYLTGAVQNANSYFRFIPVEYFMMDKDYMNAMKRVDEMIRTGTGIDIRQVVDQIVRNIPSLGYVMDETLVKKIGIDFTKASFTLPADDKGIANVDYLTFFSNKLKKWIVYRKDDADSQAATYFRVSLLGVSKQQFCEYGFGEKLNQSIIKSNNI